MRIGVVIGNPGGVGDSASSLACDYERARAQGLSTVWMTQHAGFDALTLMASWGGHDGPELGTAVIPVQTRHPIALAEQAITTQTLTGGRLTLGLGLAHSATLERFYGLSPRRSVKYLADYLDTLQALLAGTKSAFNETFRISARIGADLPTPPPVLIAALGPRMLQLAAERTAGTITWATGPRTIAEYIAPTIRAAAEAADRANPRVVVCLPFCVTENREQALNRLAQLANYRDLPSYRAMLEREGVNDPRDIAIAGDAETVREALDELRAAGATDVAAIPFGRSDEVAATWEFLGACARV
ncbi:MAG TPA: TIGR03564 family F420-dependent LLM class oxidoreductase [Acidimicrobiales bacterium]|nr:TIGR03564 family F420-dependent LLM class oxidoreductase [Acidimicrobiales bacterium]